MTQKMTPSTGSSNTSASHPGAPAPADNAASTLKDGLLSGARDVSSDVKHIAGELAGEAKKAAESKIGAGKDFAAEQLDSVADALWSTSRELRKKESIVSDYVEKAAGSVEKVSDYFQTRTLSQLVGDAEQYARREPAVFLGAAFLAGLFGGRFLKSATPARSQSGQFDANQSHRTDGRQGWSASQSAYRALPERSSAARPAQESTGEFSRSRQETGGRKPESAQQGFTGANAPSVGASRSPANTTAGQSASSSSSAFGTTGGASPTTSASKDGSNKPSTSTSDTGRSGAPGQSSKSDGTERGASGTAGTSQAGRGSGVS